MIARLGQEPAVLEPVRYEGEAHAFAVPSAKPTIPAVKGLIGVDVFVHRAGRDAEGLAAGMQSAANGSYDLVMITNRGVKVWPNGLPETSLTDHWRCRYMVKPDKQLNKAMIAELQMRLAQAGIDFIKTEHLCTFDGQPGYSLGQGQ